MRLVALAGQFTFGEVVCWGDTGRVRDEHYPYLDVAIIPSERDRRIYPCLNHVRIEVTEPILGDTQERFDLDVFVSGSKLGELEVGSILVISGPLCRERRTDKGRSFSNDIIVTNEEGWLSILEEVPEDELPRTTSLHVYWNNVEVLSVTSPLLSDDNYIAGILRALHSEEPEVVKRKYFATSERW